MGIDNSIQARQHPIVSIGIIARNEEDVIDKTLESLFRQTLFDKLREYNFRLEIIAVVNNSTDRTESLVRKRFDLENEKHPRRADFVSRCIHLKQAGKINAWNVFVHSLSSRTSEYLFLMDGDILLNDRTTLWKLFKNLMSHPQAWVATDIPMKDNQVQSPPRKSALSAGSDKALLCGQLYCIYANIARRIYLPKDLPACEDGFIKSVLCSDFLTNQNLKTERIITVEDTSHVFESYKSFTSILRQHKRQVIGQTVVYLLVDEFLPALNIEERQNLAETILKLERAEPDWLKVRIHSHIKKVKYPWRLHPHLLKHHFKQLRAWGLLDLRSTAKKLIKATVDIAAAWLAYRHLKTGFINYWPDTKSTTLGRMTNPSVLGSNT